MTQPPKLLAQIPAYAWLGSMGFLQFIWLVSIWLNVTTTNINKLPYLIVLTIISGFTVFYSKLPDLSRYSHKHLITIKAISIFIFTIWYGYYQTWVDSEEHVLTSSRFLAILGVKPFFNHYAQFRWLGIQHPPLTILLYGLSSYLLGLNLFAMRLVSIGLTWLTLGLTYWLAQHLYNRQVALNAILLEIAMPNFIRLGCAALTDMPLTFSFTLAMVLIVKLRNNPSYKLSLILGLVIGLGLLTKYTMILILPVIFADFGWSNIFRKQPHYILLTALTASITVAPWAIYSYQQGLLATQAHTITHYVTSVATTSGGFHWRIQHILFQLPSGLGVYNLPLLLLGFIYLLRQPNLIVWWVTIPCAILLATLPDARYFLPIFPAFAIMMALGLTTQPSWANRGVLLALLYGSNTLYLFIDWLRVT